MAATPSDLNHALYGLRDYLTLAREKGRTQVILSPESLDLLSALPMTLMKMPSLEQTESAEIHSVEPAAQQTVKAEEAQPTAGFELESEPQSPTVVPAPLSEKRSIEKLEPAGDTKREKLNNLFRMAKSCEACRNLGTLRDQIVFATGNPDAELMIIGEAPGYIEEQEKKPFVGPVGQKLDGIIKAMGLSRDSIYISNIVKYRPMIGDGRFQSSQNRKPTTEEMSVSLKYVMAEIDVVKPKVIVACGGTATEGLLDISGSVSRLRGQFYDLGGIPVMVTYHPSYLLRAENDADNGKVKKRMVWEDMLLVMEKMGMTISEKQRSYFA